MAKVFRLRRKSVLALRQRKRFLLRSLKIQPDFIRGSFVERYGTCGKANCACRRGKKHGPFYYLTQCLAVGNVQKFLLKDEKRRNEAKIGTDHYKQFLELLEELSQINAELLRRGNPITDTRL